MAQAYRVDWSIILSSLYLSVKEQVPYACGEEGPLVRGSHKEEHSNASRGRSRVGPHIDTV